MHLESACDLRERSARLLSLNDFHLNLFKMHSELDLLDWGTGEGADGSAGWRSDILNQGSCLLDIGMKPSSMQTQLKENLIPETQLLVTG